MDSACDELIDIFDNIGANSKCNDRTLSIVNNFIRPYFQFNDKNTFNNLIMISLANETPIAQFIVDIYFTCVLKYNLKINEFIDKSSFLSKLPYNCKPRLLIRRYLTQYSKYFYLPIFDASDANCSAEMDDIKHEQISMKKHNMAGILYYLSVIHENVYILNKVCQIDIIFIPHSESITCINNQYFDKLGFIYESIKNRKSIKKMLKCFNDKLDNKFQRCVILIINNNNVCKDPIFIFQPSHNNSLPPEICDFIEMPFICNTKTNIFPEFDLNQHYPLCLSLHTHSNAERLYFSYGSYGCRVFKFNLKDILKPFCCENQHRCGIDWNEEINDKEFKDYQFDLFVNMFFADFKIIKADISIYYYIAQLNPDNIYSKLLQKRFLKKRYMCIYIPKPIEYYLYINIKIKQHYKSMNFSYKNQFINFIYCHELENCPLSDHLGPNINVNDCVLLDFDKYFPIHDNNIHKDEFIFNFLQKFYLSFFF